MEVRCSNTDAVSLYEKLGFIIKQELNAYYRDGVFGVSFKIKGKDNNFETTINPVRTLTPRFVQRFVDIFRSSK